MSAVFSRQLIFVSMMIFFCSLFAGCSDADEKAGGQSGMNTKRVVLIGASVGRSWGLSQLQARGEVPGYSFESVTAYQYDKTAALDEVLMRPKRKFRVTRTYLKGFFAPSPTPADMIILKECAAYFPGDLDQYKRLMAKWVKTVRDAKKEVMVATVVPVTETHDESHAGRLDAILEYNDWIREFAKKENIVLLDLEAALRAGQENRHLRDELTSSDGLHLNKAAYSILDRLLIDTCAVSAGQ